MQITSIKTHKITTRDKDLLKILDKYIVKNKGLMIHDKNAKRSKNFNPPPFITHHLLEGSILVITSKIVSITQGRVVKITPGIDKDKLIAKQSQYFLPRNSNKYNTSITITQGILLGSAGIDESNGNGYYILLPKNPQDVANTIRAYIAKSLGLRDFGVIITDSRSIPLRRGAIGVALAHSGFAAVNSYIGQKDVFGRKIQVETGNISDMLAVSAVGVIGEVAEQTPLAIIEDIPFVRFQDRNPTKTELTELSIKLENDIFAPILTKAKWKKGGK